MILMVSAQNEWARLVRHMSWYVRPILAQTCFHGHARTSIEDSWRVLISFNGTSVVNSWFSKTQMVGWHLWHLALLCLCHGKLFLAHLQKFKLQLVFLPLQLKTVNFRILGNKAFMFWRHVRLNNSVPALTLTLLWLSFYLWYHFWTSHLFSWLAVRARLSQLLL